MTAKPFHWYRLLGIISLFSFLFMAYRREVHLQSCIEQLECRIGQLERQEEWRRNRAAMTELEGQSVGNVTSAMVENQAQGLNKNHSASPGWQRESPVAKQPERGVRSGSTAGLQQTPRVADEMTYPGKFRQPVKVELNTADSATLVRIPGIGGGTARAILRYREQLGGFYSPEQLREKLTWESAQNQLETWCQDWLSADEYFIQKVNVNQLSFKELLKHPYLEYADVKALCKWRDRYGLIRGESDLRQLGWADSVKLEKLLHYVEY